MDSMGRVATIGSSILAQAEKESRELIDQANRIRDRELRLAEERVTMEAGERLQRETARIRHDSSSSVAAERTRARQALLRRRDELSKLVFASVRGHLAEYARSEAYPRGLLRELGEIAAYYDHTASTVWLRAEDMAYQAEIEKLLPGCEVKPDGSMSLGGWRLRNTKASVLIDESFEARLRAQRDWYLEHCNLEVT